MRYPSLEAFLSRGAAALAAGPVAMIFVEDLVEVETTIRHHRRAGFAQVMVFAPDELVLPETIEAAVHRIDYSVPRPGALEAAVNAVIEAAPGAWFYYCYNAEYLFYPFAETRSVAEMLTFQAEERRDAVLTYVVDLYAGDLRAHPDAVSLDDAHMDRSGYYALARPDPANHGHPRERQLNFYGGLRWRFEEHVPEARRKIDRIALFRARPGLRLRSDHTFSDEEYNTYACKWHNNITAAIDIRSFSWHNSVPFDWHSQQLLDLGLMEPGQWF
jgi:hypothetical protein